MQKCIHGIRDFSSENCCYGYQIQINNQFMPILFNFIVFSNTQNFLFFFWTVSCIVITQSGRKKLGGHHACLGDIMQNIAKIGVFSSFPRGAWGEFYKSWLKIEQILIFPINFTKCQFNCIIFVKEHRNLSKIIILPSCAEELRSAKRRNDLNPCTRIK